jgi:hypothetical protein
LSEEQYLEADGEVNSTGLQEDQGNTVDKQILASSTNIWSAVLIFHCNFVCMAWMLIFVCLI